MNRPAEWAAVPLIRTTAEFFAGKGIASARLDAELLLEHVTGMKRLQLLTREELRIRDPELSRYRELVRRRAAGEPVAYLTGTKEFWSLPFRVTPAVLVPRPETEVLVDETLKHVPHHGAVRVLDIGTGSGCIAIAIAHTGASATVVATDVSADALCVASENAARHGVAGRIEFRKGSLFGPVAGQTFDVIVSNPPYVAENDAGLEPAVKRFEPATALFAGADGLDAYRGLAKGLQAVLADKGTALFEIGAGQGAAVSALFSAQGFKGMRLVADGAGIDRVVVVTREAAADAPAREWRVEPVRDVPQEAPAPAEQRTAVAALSEEPTPAELERMLDAYGSGGEEEPIDVDDDS